MLVKLARGDDFFPIWFSFEWIFFGKFSFLFAEFSSQDQIYVVFIVDAAECRNIDLSKIKIRF